MSNTKNFFRFRKIVLDFFLWLCYYISVAWRQDPGVAKFGIALEWGSRGLEFESRHSDQKTRTTFVVLVFFFSCGEIRTIKCECPVDIRSFPAGRERHLSVPNLDTRTKKPEQHLLFWFFLFVWRDSNHQMRMSCGHLLVSGWTETIP